MPKRFDSLVIFSIRIIISQIFPKSLIGGRKETCFIRGIRKVQKALEIEREVVYHLGKVRNLLSSGEVDDALVENFDETHFVFNVDSGQTLVVKGARDVRFADVVSDTLGSTMVEKLTGGVRSKVGKTLIIFQNEKESYPIQRVPDDLPNVSYRFAAKGFMRRKVLSEYLLSRKVNLPDRHGRTKIIYCDNAPRHRKNAEIRHALRQLNAKLVYLPKNATHLVQPADNFVIQKLKSTWLKLWNRKKR
ncbi:hypothetical protein P9112_005536 [Eukaryota sp. TZLM1-RC]